MLRLIDWMLRDFWPPSSPETATAFAVQTDPPTPNRQVNRCFSGNLRFHSGARGAKDFGSRGGNKSGHCVGRGRLDGCHDDPRRILGRGSRKRGRASDHHRNSWVQGNVPERNRVRCEISRNQSGWVLVVRCGDESILAAERSYADAERAALKRELELRTSYAPNMAPCSRVFSVDLRGEIVMSETAKTPLG